MSQHPQGPEGMEIEREGQTLFELTEDGVNLWWTTVQSTRIGSSACARIADYLHTSAARAEKAEARVRELEGEIGKHHETCPCYWRMNELEEERDLLQKRAAELEARLAGEREVEDALRGMASELESLRAKLERATLALARAHEEMGEGADYAQCHQGLCSRSECGHCRRADTVATVLAELKEYVESLPCESTCGPGVGTIHTVKPCSRCRLLDELEG